MAMTTLDLKKQAQREGATADEGQGVRIWEKQVEISEEIDDLTDDEVLDLALAWQDKDLSTVRDVLKVAVEEARSKYLPVEGGEANIHCWALVRVGLKRIICKKVSLHRNNK